MAKNTLRQLPIHAFLGDQQSNESLTLSQVHSTGGSKNIWLNKFGSIEPIGGYRKQNPTPMTGGAGPMRLIDLHPYTVFQRIDGDLVSAFQIVGIFRGDETSAPGSDPLLKFCVSLDGGATWTEIDSFTDPLSAHNIYFAQLGTSLVVTGLTQTPLRWDGTTLVALNTLQTLAAPAVADAGAGVLNGNYKYRVIDLLTDGTRGPARPASLLTNLVNRQATVTWAASTSPILESYEVYRTTGADLVYFRASAIAAGTLTYTDNVADIDLILDRVLQEHGDPPPLTLFSFVHKQRVWYGQTYVAVSRDPEFPRRWYYSDPGMPDSVHSDLSYFDLSDGDSAGDVTTGGVGDFNDSAVLFNEHSIWTVTGTGRYIGTVIDWNLKRSNARTGTVNVDTVLRIPAGSVYTDQRAGLQTTSRTLLAYLTPTLDIRLFDGDSDTIISYPVAVTLKKIGLSYNKRMRCRAFLDDSRSEAVWLITADAPRPNLAVVWNYRHGVWYVREWAFACAAVYSPQDEATIILAGQGDVTIGGYCYLLWSGSSFDGDSFITQWMSKTLYGLARPGEMEQSGEFFSATKRFRWLECLFGLTGPLSMEVAWFPYEAKDDAEPVATTTVTPGELVSLYSADGSQLLSADGSALTILKIGDGAIVRAQLMDENGRYYHDRGMRIRIRSVQGDS